MRNKVIFSMSVSSMCFFIFLLLKPFQANTYIQDWNFFLVFVPLAVFVSVLASFVVIDTLSGLFNFKDAIRDNEILHILLLDLAVIPFLMLLFTLSLQYYFLSIHTNFIRLEPKLLCNILFMEFILFTPETFILKYYKKEEELRKLKDINLKIAAMKTEDLTSGGETDSKELVVIKGEYKDSALELEPNNIIYIEVVANYVCIHYYEESEIRTRQIRTTLKQLHKSLDGFPFLVQTHRSYIVNIHHILSIERESSTGQFINMEGGKQRIPISRTNYEKINRLFSKNSLRDE